MTELDLSELRLIRIHLVAAQLALADHDVTEAVGRINDAKLAVEQFVVKVAADVELNMLRSVFAAVPRRRRR